jgi:hypothetical protein
MQATRLLCNILYIFGLIFNSAALMVILALKQDMWILSIAVVSSILGIAGAVINFVSPSYKSEEELEKLKEEYGDASKHLDELRMKYAEIFEKTK